MSSAGATSSGQAPDDGTGLDLEASVPSPNGSTPPDQVANGSAPPEHVSSIADAPPPAVDASTAESQSGATAASAGADVDDEEKAQADTGEEKEGGPATPVPPMPRRRRKRSFWRELPILVAVALLLAVLIKTYALQAFFIPSGSMENTLDINDRVLINKLVYDFRGIHRGDIVVFNGDGSWDPGPVPSNSNPFSEFVDNLGSMFGFGHPGAIYVKRVIGLPGDRVFCCDAQGRMTVNGVPISEGSYLFPGNAPSQIRINITVPPGRLWVMGDHRDISDDSRGHLGYPGGGTVPQSAVLGRVFVIIWPPSRWRFLPIPGTFEQPALSKQAVAGAAGGNGDVAAGLVGARLEPAGLVLPWALGFAGAVPITWLQRQMRGRAHRRRRRRGRETP